MHKPFTMQTISHNHVRSWDPGLCAGGAAAEAEGAKPGGGGEVCTSQWEGGTEPADAADTDWPCCTERCNKAEGELIH